MQTVLDLPGRLFKPRATPTLAAHTALTLSLSLSLSCEFDLGDERFYWCYRDFLGRGWIFFACPDTGSYSARC